MWVTFEKPEVVMAKAVSSIHQWSINVSSLKTGVSNSAKSTAIAELQRAKGKKTIRRT